MGTHSAFFVPAKYGVMPEILPPHLLSKGNGLLESLSFLAVILGTVSGGVLSFLFLREEYVIGVILLVLASVGAVASLLIHRMPAANPTLKFPPYLYQPLIRSIRTLFSTKALIFAVIGIAFFTFVVAFMRATVYMLGESRNPRWDELRTSAIVGTVALGIGLGSPLAGWLSGRKVELGLIPIGAVGMIVGCICAAFSLDFIPGLVASIILIGFSTGFYLVPLFTLLQYRAPKTGKGDMIATSNFINVTGAIAASALFFFLVFLAKRVDFIAKVDVEDNYARGTLSKLQIEHGRPVYFEVDDEFETITGGRPSDPNAAPPNVMDQLFGEARAKNGATVVHLHRGIEPGDAVIVSHSQLRGVEHYRIRGEDESLQPAYDRQHLPRFLFLGAGLMTLATLLLLWRRLPDLFQRSGWLLQSLRGPRAIVNGIDRLPASGPTVLVTAAVASAIHHAMLLATDRYTRVFSGNLSKLGSAVRLLRKGHSIAVVTAAADSEEFLRKLVAEVCIDIVPVYSAVANGVITITFGKAIVSTTPIDEVRHQIQAARFIDDV